MLVISAWSLVIRARGRVPHRRARKESGVTEPTVLLMGNTARPELAEARNGLDGLARVIPAADADAAAALLADEEIAVDVIVVAQAYPGQFSGEALDRLGRQAPLARVVVLLGSWCEGEVRSGRPIPGAIRVYWHQWPARCAQELGRLRRGLCASWCLPPTAVEEERFLALADQPWPRREGLIAVHSPSFDMRDWLCRACRRAGYSTAEGDNLILALRKSGQSPGITAAVFDAIDCRGQELDDLKRWAAAVEPAPVIVLMSFPRVEDRDRVLAAGAAALLSKPLLLDDLFWQLERAEKMTKEQGPMTKVQ